jgi:tRNA(Ile)-lysidine synthase
VVAFEQRYEEMLQAGYQRNPRPPPPPPPVTGGKKRGRPAQTPPLNLLDRLRDFQAETLAFRALRGSGAVGLAAMAALRAAPECLILRPLLGLAPVRLEAVVAAAGLSPVRDPSNDNPRFARIRLRQALGDPGGEGEGVRALAEAAQAFARRRTQQEAALLARLAAAAEIRPEAYAWVDPKALGADAIGVAALARLIGLIGSAAWPVIHDKGAAWDGFLQGGGKGTGQHIG